MKIVIVMTYYNRPFQLNRTLLSIAKSKHPNFEVVVVDDCSDEEIVQPATPYPLTILRTRNKKWTNPEPAYNLGLIRAMSLSPDVIIIQNAECYHVGDIISKASIINDDTYLAFSCFSLDKETTFKEHDIFKLTNACKRPAKFDGDLAWYNHPIYRPNAFDFCSAITVKNMRILNGYDERFSDGWAYGDNYLIERIKWLGLKVVIPIEPFVVHQWHYERVHPADYIRLDARNKLLFSQLRQSKDIKAKHIYTRDL